MIKSACYQIKVNLGTFIKTEVTRSYITDGVHWYFNDEMTPWSRCTPGTVSLVEDGAPKLITPMGEAHCTGVIEVPVSELPSR